MIDVKVVLRQNVDGLGRRGDVVEVSPGYARNFLEPRGLAIKATEGSEAQAEAMRRSRNLKDAKDREAAEEIAKTLVPATITVSARAGSGGKLFGSITEADLAKAVLEQTRIELDRRSIHLDEHIKTVGSHSAQVRLHADVEFSLNVEVSAS